MIHKTRGDTFFFPFTAPDDMVIESGSTVKCGVRSTLSGAEYSLFQEKIIENETKDIDFVFSAKETAKLTPSEELAEYGASYIVEVEVTLSDGVVITAFQEELEVGRDYIYD